MVTDYGVAVNPRRPDLLENGTVTDFDGNFMLSAPKGSTIGISYIGYKSQDIINQGQSNLIVVLQEDTEVLDEIVVIGYATYIIRSSRKQPVRM